MDSITLIKPDDWHVHLRDGDALLRTVPDIAASFGRALIMPNLDPPLDTVAAVKIYRETIINHIPSSHHNFIPLMTLYLTESITVQEIEKAKQSGVILGAKLYPAGATTHSAAGVKNLSKLYPIFDALQHHELVLEIHGEVTNPNSDIFDRERLFINQQLIPLRKNFPKLRIVLEHISSKAAVDYISTADENIAATITVHHLLYNRNDLLVGGIKPHYYCLPILKSRADQKSLITAATSGSAKFFLGTDSAPHAIKQKESACGCAGIYSSPVALSLCTELFEAANTLDKLENFTSGYGADFYKLARNTDKLTLIKQAHIVPEQLVYQDGYIKPLWAGQCLQWKILHE